MVNLVVEIHFGLPKFYSGEMLARYFTRRSAWGHHLGVFTRGN